MLKIVLKLKEKELKTLETDKPEITIGRQEDNDIHINNLGASKKHARIFRRDGIYILEDLRNTNGTLLNDETVQTAKLKENDVVTIGKHALYISNQNNRETTAGDFAEKTVKINNWRTCPMNTGPNSAWALAPPPGIPRLNRQSTWQWKRASFCGLFRPPAPNAASL